MTARHSLPRRLVVGIGNPWRGDDALGLVVARRLRPLVTESVTIREVGGDLTALLELWHAADSVILVDAVQSGASPGTIRRFEVGAQQLPSQAFRTSTHAFGLAETLELARVLGQLPAVCIVYGVEGAVWDLGASLSPVVEASIREVLTSIQHDLGQASIRRALF